MTDDVTVRLTDAGPARIRGNGVHWERGETRTVGPDHAEALVEVHGDGVETVNESSGEDICGAEQSDGSTCERPAGECPYHSGD